MSIEQTDTVDLVNIDCDSGEVLLTISDHLSWDECEGEHLLALQKKLNAYLRFIESGEVFETFPESRGLNVVINLVGKYPLSDKANQFLQQASAAVRGAGFKLQFKILHPN